MSGHATVQRREKAAMDSLREKPTGFQFVVLVIWALLVAGFVYVLATEENQNVPCNGTTITGTHNQRFCVERQN